MEDDLNRIRLARRCGTDFLQRRDAFRRAYEVQCVQTVEAETQDIDQINQCGLALRGQFGFPGAQCADESPMAELDGAIHVIPQVALEPAASPGDTPGQDAAAEPAVAGEPDAPVDTR